MAPLTDDDICYSERYYDDVHEYRHVKLPKSYVKDMKKFKNQLLTEYEWRELGVQMSRGWIHYALHKPEPHVLLFRECVIRRPLRFQDLPTQDQQSHLSQADQLVADAQLAMKAMEDCKGNAINPYGSYSSPGTYGSVPFAGLQSDCTKMDSR